MSGYARVSTNRLLAGEIVPRVETMFDIKTGKWLLFASWQTESGRARVASIDLTSDPE